MNLFEEVVLPPGEKIRRLRGYLGIKQHEITGGKFTRNLVSYIENGKAKLVRDTAIVISENINKIAQKKKFPINIDADYLMKDEITQANDILDKYIYILEKYLENNDIGFEKELDKAIKILKEWSIDEKRALIYEIAGDYNYKQEKYNEGYIEYFKALESNIRIENHHKTAWLYFKLGRTAIWLNNYQEAINLNNYSLVTLEKYSIDDIDMISLITFNNALSYKKLKNYDKCLNQLDKLEKLLDNSINKTQYIDVSILRANCYFEQGKYSMSEDIYKKILNDAFNIESKGIINFNLGEIYEKYNHFEESIEYIKKSLELRSYIDSYYLIDSYLAIGKNYTKIGKYELAKENLLKALEMAKDEKRYILIIDIYKELLELYIEQNNDMGIYGLIKEVKNIINDNDIRYGQVKDIFFKGAYYYIEKDIYKSKELLNFGLNIIDQN